MPLPLYHRPSTLVFLDDDANYLETLALVIPQDWGVRLFTHADDCLAHFQQQYSLWEADVWYHQELANTCRAGGQLIPQILEYWLSNSHRYRLTRICVVDFAMPAMTGIDFLKLLPVWPEHRVLLTGQADELIAVGAFNEGLINSFVPKQHPHIGKHLTTLLTNLRVSPMNLHEGIWRSTLLQEQYAVLQESTVRLELATLAKERQWIEYVVLPSPFGILALDRHARAHWLQLELRSELATMAELAESTGQPSATAQKIREGTHLINTEFLMALGSDEEAAIKTSFAIGATPNLLGALFRITPDKVYGQSYQEFLASLPPRAISGDSLA